MSRQSSVSGSQANQVASNQPNSNNVQALNVSGQNYRNGPRSERSMVESVVESVKSYNAVDGSIKMSQVSHNSGYSKQG